jgi:hypothetical protein
MKHGDKTKGKASKASGKKASKSGKGASKTEASSKSKSSPQKTSSTASKPKGGNGDAPAARTAGDGFTNPVVAAAFKHAVKKYPNAFRKLTD